MGTPKTDDNAAIAGKVFEIRHNQLGLTQRELADILKVDPVNVSRWERGETRPKMKNIRALAKLAKRPVAWFFEEVAA